MYLTNTARKYMDEVLGSIKNHIIYLLFYKELLELEQYVTIYSLKRSIYECLLFVWQRCLVIVSLEFILSYYVLLRYIYNGLRSNHNP